MNDKAGLASLTGAAHYSLTSPGHRHPIPLDPATMRIVSTEQATKPKGHYSQAVVHNGVVYVSGQLATDLSDPNAPPGDMADQTRNVLGHVREILEAAGSGLDLMLQATVFISDISQWGAVNEAFGEILGDHRPTRAVIPVSTLPGGRLIEMQVIAALPEGA